MDFTASSIIRQARSVADLQETKNISYQDEVDLLNESWRELYSRYTESDSDYWITETVIPLLSSYQDPNSQNAYLVPLPDDFYKLRTVSWNTGNLWRPMDKFAIAQRDWQPAVPMYRMKNTKLWIVCPLGMVPEIKVDYYTPPPTITLPQDPLEFLTSVPAYSLPDYQPGAYVESEGVLAYILTTAKTIRATNQKSGVDTLLYTSTNAITSLRYYGGYLFWIDTVTGALNRAPTNFTATLVPAAIVGTGVVNFGIQDGFVYYSTATQTFRVNPDGSGSISPLPVASTDFQLFNGLSLYITGSGFVAYNLVVSTQAATAIRQFDGAVYIQVSNTLMAVSFDDAFALTVGDVIYTDVLYAGQVNDSGYLPTRTSETIEALSLILDYAFSYPTNEVNEIMIYTTAYAFARKSSDKDRMGVIDPTIATLWKRFASVNKQDEYEFSRINNYYGDSLGYWY
jgi:hypothetical protein